MWYIMIAKMFPRRLYLKDRRKCMRRQKIYLDTSVISYLYQEDAPEKMKDTLKLWEVIKRGRSRSVFLIS